MLTKSLGVLISIFMNVVSVFLLCVEVTRGTVYGAGEGGGFAPVLREETTQQHQGTLTSQTLGLLTYWETCLEFQLTLQYIGVS